MVTRMKPREAFLRELSERVGEPKRLGRHEVLCRAGITTDVAERRAHWSREHPSLSDWKLIGVPYSSTAEAQAAEDSYREVHGCHGAPGDPEMPGRLWWVYHFEYDPLVDAI